jgi:aminopeptidase
MPDPRNADLARMLCNYSLDVQKGEHVGVNIYGVDGLELGQELVREITRRGGIPFFNCSGDEVHRVFFEQCAEEQIKSFGSLRLDIMKRLDAFVAVDAQRNPFELSRVDETHNKWRAQYLRKPMMPLLDEKKWVYVRYPNEAMAYAAMRPTAEFRDFYYRVCNVDYSRLSAAMQPLKTLMEKTDQVRIKGPGTDLTLSIKGFPAIPCDGHSNVPDGECFTTPVRDAVNGTIQYNTRTLYQAQLFTNIRFHVEQGRIVEAACAGGDSAKLNEILDTDEGSRYFGEFALGLNPAIEEPILDILFDEKIYGSFHLTPGAAYEKCNNGNQSAVHWDIVCLQTPEHGGGEIYFDGVLIRKDGAFVVAELKGLNREALLG